MPVIALLTDFGHQDPYVGQMKGAILRHAPGTTLVDLCHEVRPQDVGHGAFILEASHAHFPSQTIFVCVVDPGVGTDRAILLAFWNNQWFLAPDNGLLDFLRADHALWWRLTPPPGVSSQTFHGRDIFAPMAARLSRGVTPDSLGTRTTLPGRVHAVQKPAATRTAESISCRVLHVDRFGNCLLNLPIHPLAKHWRLVSGHVVDVVGTYADIPPGQAGLIAGSQGVMELAMNQASCAQRLGLVPGDTVALERRPQQERP